ncbi:radical SAM superfamily enzyme YgiQ (UPF0313 family) [Peptoniphilus ivorii]|uniref:B12-binding domain-containing radical SAM protein n=1 Tax=Aedoeadaptatus ivorii TaxID=54006 RepID=UPI0027828814|nr:DUF4080 domain-containing protein [Peptoniphilus ivorii]MDQ0508078.1 radical SAM superfamily enzyme YgiQ (UPF0313 family) [Peptoniphilus ivorii]
MKGLLVAQNASYVHTNLAVRLLREQLHKDISILEMTVNEDLHRRIGKILLAAPDYILYSAYIWNWTDIQRIGEYIRKADPHIAQYVGGPEVSYDVEERLRNEDWIDGILRGEGENTIGALVECIEGRRGRSEVAGLAYREGEEVRVNPLPAYASDLNALIPASYTESMKNRILYYESMRGCPYHCSYCLSSEGGRIRYRDVKKIKEDMREIFATGTKLIKFVDRSFHIDPARSVEIIDFFSEESPADTGIHFEMNLEHLDREVAKHINAAPAGKFQIEAGIQSVNPVVNAAIHRKTDIDAVGRALQMLDTEKTHIHLDLIVGLPHEDLESFLAGFDRVAKLGAQKIQIGFLKLLRGTELRRRAEEFGIVYESTPPYEVIATADFSAREVILLRNFATAVENYFDEARFREVYHAVQKKGTPPSQFYLGIAQKLQDDAHRRLFRGRDGKYRFLHRHLNEKYGRDAPLYDALKKDFYRNEDRYIGHVLGIEDPELSKNEVIEFLKRNPEFASDRNPHKAAKRVRGVRLANTKRYYLYTDGKYIRHFDERR